MAITFAPEQQKKQRYFVFIFVGAILVTLFVVWRGILAPAIPMAPLPAQPVKPQEPEINFDVLRSEFLQTAEAFPKIQELTADEQALAVGRENPFVLYGGTSQPAETEE